MHDPDPRWDQLESFERLLSPLEKLVTLPVALELHLQIEFQRARRPEKIHLHRVIHHQIDGHKWLDDFRVATQPRDCATHRREINNQRHTGEILQHNARHHERNLCVGWRFCVPVRQRLDILTPDLFAVAIAQHRFEYNANAHWQP